jgi:predicted aspartyl protease
MGIVYAEIMLENAGDVAKARDGFIPEREVRQMTVNAMVDTGAWTLVINENMRTKLGLRIVKPSIAELAGGVTAPGGLTEPITIYWKDRRCSCEAVALPQEEDVLLGALPLESMDLTVHPKSGEVVGAHGDTPMCVVK